MAKRGRPARAGERATARVELRLTLAEYKAVRAFAATNGAATVADAIRLALLNAAAECGADAPVTVGRGLARIVAGSNSAGVKPSVKGSTDR